jgi:hypothetical protein
MRIKVLAALALLGYVSTASAESGVIVDRVPSAADPAIVVAIVRQAFLLMDDWKIEAEDLESVTGTFAKGDARGRIKVFLSKRQLLYDGRAESRAGNPYGSFQSWHGMTLPELWITTLRHDIAMAVSTLPNKPTP